MRAKSRRSAETSPPAWAAQLGNDVRERRKALRLTQRELADLARCGPDFIYDLERGKPTVRLDKLMMLLETLGLQFELKPRTTAAR